MKIAVYDHPLLLEHITGQRHVERPARVSAIRDMLVANHLDEALLARESPAAPLDWLRLNHGDALLAQLAATRDRDGMWLDADTVTSRHSFDAALVSVGGAVDAVRAVTEGELDGALVMARPPGHHAERDAAMGFCLVNNVAVAARWALAEGLAKRVAIVDWDVHHGNGTQWSFYDDPRVLYVSLHRFPFYPGTGAADELGKGAGRGTTLNVPLPAGVRDPVYAAAFERVVMPKLRAFAPDLLLVSAGYDAHMLDPIGGMHLSVKAFAAMTRALTLFCTERGIPGPVLLLEGGYSLEGLADSVHATLDQLLHPADVPLSSEPLAPDVDALLTALAQTFIGGGRQSGLL